MSYSTEMIRNIAVVGHGGTGKTSFVEQLLYIDGLIDSPAAVETGKTVSDYSEEEIQHGISIHTSIAHIFWQDYKINLLDTPGAADFVGEVVASFRAAESALITVGAKSGVEIETIKLWRRLEQRRMPRMVFINKMDKDGADFRATLEDLQSRFDTTFIPVTIPMGQADSYEGVINLINMQAYAIPSDGKSEKPMPIPDSYKEIVEEFHRNLVEYAAEGDDQLLQKYLETEDLTIEEVKLGLTEGLRTNRLVPVLCGSAIQGSGFEPFLDFLSIAAPSPTGIDERALDDDENEYPIKIDPSAPLSCLNFKTIIDQFSGKLSYVKVVTGVLKPDMEIYNYREHKKERVSKIFIAQGKSLEEVDALSAGDIGVLAKIESAHTNDAFCDPAKVIHFVPLQLPQPTYTAALTAENKGDMDKLSQLLHRAAEEDKTFTIEFNPETKETVIKGMGELHFNIIFERALKKNKIAYTTATPKVAYRETITKQAAAEYSHKKQTGGHGQFARVVLEIAPLPRGEQFSFVNAIHGGSISKGYLPGVEKGIIEGMESGILAGYPVVDIEAKVVDGKEHPVDSSEMAFKIAARGALREAMQKAGSILLEPIMDLRVFIDEQYLGDVLSDLSSKRGRVQGQESLGGNIVEVDAKVPQAELLRYSVDLRSITSGTGAFELSFSHYDHLTGRQADEVMAAGNTTQD
ncbi:elongation factor G [Spirochaeta africana]|uniref:Elongation factor G n=1 Tax=Spirochaeta africana (strain ATCC 700263 / DSM 8902 / Z-7692) TaxID=889378 RepID=H9UJ43_SPIAZ|nr:elongation factor G [Spirochaeta africana]AFG37536.1 small GTP-binding protein domain protein [Spirochaeta africana DSM 8902]